MNHHQDFSGLEWTDVQLSESEYSLLSELESTADQSHLFETTNDASADHTFGMVELTPANAREYNHTVGDVTTSPIQQKAIPINTSSENADLKGRSVSITDDQASKLERKRKIDRAYRQRCKENKRKNEEEIETLRQEKAELQKKIHQLEMKPEGDRQQNASELYCLIRIRYLLMRFGQIMNDRKKMEFRLNCYDDVSRAEAMKIVGGVTGVKRICMDIEENKLTLHGKDIDTLPLQRKLRKICDARLLSLSMETKKELEKEEENIVVERDCMVVARKSAFQSSVPMSCAATSYAYPFPHIASAYQNGGAAEECFDLAKAAPFLLFIFVVLMLAFACCVLYFR